MSLSTARPSTPQRVLIVTGGYLADSDDSLLQTARKQLVQARHARRSWLEAKVKATVAEPVLLGRLHARLSAHRYGADVQAFLRPAEHLDTPELTEVVLATALAKCGLEFDVLTIDELLRQPSRSETRLRACSVVFLSSTFLRDLSELDPLVARVKRSWNRVVVGGALAGTLREHWQGSMHVDVLAIGYGEMLVPALAAWIRSGFETLTPPVGGRVTQAMHTQFLFSGVPASLSLDALDRPDWSLAAQYRQRDFRLIHYESVRGCPYRCAFCNYPFLFDDTKFRTKSAERMADDWAHYVQTMGVEYISCLDSLFTMPKARLVAFCRALLTRDVRVKWICYARADDLCDPEVVALMREAGCVQVQIGIESGDQGQLDRMNKRTTVRDNGRALDTCRAVGLTTVISLVVGFPGETRETLQNTLQFLAASPPDFHFLATFSTRVPNVPILRPEEARRHGLVTDANLHTVSPYWVHDTMSCADVGNHVRQLSRALITQRISLDAALFYQGILQYRASLRDDLLAFQANALQRGRFVTRVFDGVNRFIDRRLRADVSRALPVVTNGDPRSARYL